MTTYTEFPTLPPAATVTMTLMTPTPVAPAESVLARAVSLVRLFDTQHAVIGVSDAARRTGLAKSTAHRLLNELADLRVLERTGGGFRLGLLLFELGALVPVHHSLATVARPVMTDLRDTTKGRIHLAVLDGTEVVYVDIVGEARTAIASRVGGRLPAHTTGVGKVILAYSPAATVDGVLKTGLPRITPRTLHTPGALLRELEQIRHEGQGYDREESHPGISCVAAPIFDSEGGVIAGISITGPTRLIDPNVMGLAVRTAARTISRQIGAAQA